MEIPGSMPPLIQEMLEEMENLQKQSEEEQRADKNITPTHTPCPHST
jgi:hypothetical protein